MQTERKKVGGGILQFAICNLPFAIFIFLIAGCSSVSLPSLPSWPWSTPASQPNATVEALFEEGMAHFNNKKYSLAIDRFQRVKAEFPFSPQLVPTELKLAEAYYLNKQYPEAAAAFKEFQTLHPSNENIPFVAYHLGLVFFEQFTSSDRYQKVTEIAKGYFESVVKDHPSSPYAAPAREKLAKCIEYLSEHEFNIAVFYFNEKKYPAAIDRLEGILRRYRDTPFAVKALYYLGESYRLEKNTVKAALAYEALVQHYPNDPLAKTAQARVSELAQEKQDPLAMLLKREGRPASPRPESSQQLAESSQQSAKIQNPKSKIENLNLVAKKEVVHEEPGTEKGMLRRVVDTLNPFASSSNNKKEEENKKAEAGKEESSGFFSSLWRGISPSGTAKKEKIDAPTDSQLVSKVDESLKQQGIDSGAQNLTPTPPAADLPKVEAPAPPPSDTKELLGSIDTGLKKEGKKVAELPPPPEPAAIFRATASDGRKSTSPSTTATSSSPATAGLIGGIDEALRRKGIEPSKMEAAGKSGEPKSEEQSSKRQTPVVSSPKKVELAPKLPQEKGPFFLDTGEYQAREKPKESPASEPVGIQPARSAEPTRELPQAVVKGPPQPGKEKAAETKVAEKKKSLDEEEEPKGALDQLREDIGRLRDLLNPFGW